MLYPQGHRQISGLSPYAKKLVGELTTAHVKPRHIMKAIEGAFPSLKPNMRYIYNCRDMLRRERSEDRNAAQEFLHQAVQNNYLFWLDSDEMGRVTHTFIAHPTSVNLVSTYLHVIYIDAMYKTNKYLYPLVEIVGVKPTNKNFLVVWALLQHEDAESYRWMLSTLKNLIGCVTPNVIVSDRDLALCKYISEVFPTSAHLLCT
ncbi:protein FAR-RED ELONGATED HYPOCOTYL 3-like [Beta vulgaris subsp. vulgaris]|uniref:protein FAR-RED ELONGATED HYPOCOTYL 3-like n=1 Tax=Beta vulgaris subsp. vulgaris TaxID=3555 RepID=UPI00053FDD3B|nr:protein FAR-RED ELONGATED HYPOCOTYL 3-like [Beta vulgaris subsp. vulgaris]